MPVSAEDLYQMSQVEPALLGEDIISPDQSYENMRQQAVSWIGDRILPIAEGEVAIPFLRATGFDSVSDFVSNKFANIPQITQMGWINKGEALFDGAVISYGRSEINKCINSTSPTYDNDSDQDRIQGNQRLEKLLTWSKTLIETQGGGEAGNSPSVSNLKSISVPNRFIW